MSTEDIKEQDEDLSFTEEQDGSVTVDLRDDSAPQEAAADDGGDEDHPDDSDEQTHQTGWQRETAH